MTAGRAQEPTPEQLAGKGPSNEALAANVRAGIDPIYTTGSAANSPAAATVLDSLSDLVARLQAAETARDQAEQERDEAMALLADRDREIVEVEVHRDRLAAALRYMAEYEMTGTERTLHIDFQGRAREALNPGDGK